MSAAEALVELEELERFLGALTAKQALGDHICCAAQPETVNGSPEVLVETGVEAGAAVTGRWGDSLVASLEGKGTEFEIRAAIQGAGERFDLEALAKEAEELILRGLMLGALDSLWERENDEEVAPATFADAPRGRFVYAPFSQAIALFEQRLVLPPAAFRALEVSARRRAFTVAGLAKQELLDATHAELARQLRDKQQGGAGANLRDFQKFAKTRLESAGWTPSNPSHVETIFRTNGMSAIASGRAVEMSQPAVIAALPYWQIRTVKDARQRRTHFAADGVVLPANHPFWRLAYPPFGFNCRCRVCARSKRWVEQNGIIVGPPPVNLPDPGFESGTRALISVPPATLQPAAAARPPLPQRPPVPQRAPVSPSLIPSPTQPVPLPSLGQGTPAPGFAIPAPPLPMRPKPATFEARNITVGTSPAEHDAIQATAEKLFGRALDPSLVERLSGSNIVPGIRYSNVTARGGEVNIHTVFRTEAGEATVISRKFLQNKAGETEVYHSLFEIDEKLQGRGIAKAVLREQLLEYRQLGVKRVSLTAAWTGRYTWPRMGFRYVGTEGQFQQVLGAFRAFLGESVGKRAAAKIASNVTTLRQMAMAQVGERKVGQEFLTKGLGEGIMLPMELKLDPADPNFKTVAQYLGI